MKVLLTHSYFLRFDEKQLSASSPYPPLATLYAAALLRRNGFDVKVHDIQFAHSPQEIEVTLKDFQPALFVIYDDGFNYLTKMCLTNMRDAAFRMQKLAKKYHCTVAVSSSDASDHEELYFSNDADFIIKGEGEQTLLELASAIKDKNSPDSIAGLVYKVKGEIKNTTARVVMRDLDKLPFPAWDLIDLRPYEKIWRTQQGYFSINLVSTRGCPYKCNWCAKPIYGNRYNSHSPAYMIEMIQHLQTLTQFEHVWFADDIFGLKPGWLSEFADCKLKANLNFTYKIQSRADLLIEENAVKDLKRSGCTEVWMGAESGSQRILDAMDKGITVDEIYKATRLLKSHGIRAAFFLQFGYPGEKIEDILLTIKMLDQLMPDDIGVSVSYPLPGTPFYERVKQELSEKANWKDSDDLALMFRNEYPAEFYKQLHRYVHKHFRTRQALANLSLVLKGKLKDTHLKRLAAFPYYSIGAALEKSRLNKILKHDAGRL